MSTNQGEKFTVKDWKKLEKELLKDSAIKAEVERLEPEYLLAQQIIKARLAKRLTQEELAEKAGFKQAYIAKIESGTANPTIESVNRLATALDKKLKLVGA